MLVSFALLVMPSYALAQSDDDQQAHVHFDSGHLHFERGEYPEALSEFVDAYDLSHRAPLLFNIYLTLERLGRWGEAADRLSAYLSSDVEIDPTERTNLESRLANLRTRAAEAAATPESTPAPTPPPDSGGLHELGIGGVIALGVGAASLIGFGIAGGLALSEDSRLANTCGRNAGSFCSDSDVAGLRSMDVAADVLLSIGLVAAAAGAVLLIIDLTSSHGPSTTTAHLSPLVAPSLAGITIGGRW
jgi:hypothetical protein